MIRVAILGAGIGAEHLAGYQALPDLFEVALICDLDLARAARIAGDIAVSDDAEAAIAGPGIDLIDICLPPDLHQPFALKALAAGKSVICEKPVATSLADCAALAEAEKASKGQLFPVFQYRFGPAMQALRALHQAGLLGRPHMAALETHWARDAAYYAIPWRGTWAGERGGSTVTHAIHAHDLLCALFGPVAEVSARLDTRINDIETEDSAALTFVMAGGAMATSSVTLGAARDTSRIKLVFEHLTATNGDVPYAPMTGPWQFEARDAARQAQVDQIVAQLVPRPTGFAGLLAEVAKALSDQPNEAVTLADGTNSIALITAIYASARAGGRFEPLPIAASHPLYGGWQPGEV